MCLFRIYIQYYFFVYFQNLNLKFALALVFDDFDVYLVNDKYFLYFLIRISFLEDMKRNPIIF